MTVRTSMMWKSALLLAMSATSVATFAQNRRADAAFTATGTNCEDVTWSDDALAQYPNIADACQGVMQREGKYYVKFEGEVRRVRDRGQQITVDFRGGDTLTLSPPENMSLTIDGRTRQASALRPGDELTFYVPQDQLTADFFADENATAAPQVVPITPSEELVAQDNAGASGALPTTASVLPYGAVAGVLLLAAGGLLTLRRKLVER
ncbi:MAG TPA: hypothetical protein VFV10_06860 [Gammaproteobacteria bacterium]|nr:hypothetical protein [Gammaproteobacteria bacterium]